MKKKLLITTFAICAMSIAACGGENTNDAQSVENTETQKVETAIFETESIEETTVMAESGVTVDTETSAPDDGIIDFTGNELVVTYTRHEISQDYEGNPVLLYYYNYTNNSAEAAGAAFSSYIQVFQNGVECESGIMSEQNEQMDNYLKDVQPGTTIEVCQAFKLTDMSPVTVEASELISLSNDKDTQVINLE